jgi:hypothetical protein
LPATRIDADLLLRGEALLSLVGLAGCSAAVWASSLPLAAILLALAAAVSVRALHARASIIRGRALCWNGHWYWAADGAIAQGLPGQGQHLGVQTLAPVLAPETLHYARACFGVLLLGFSGPAGGYRLVVLLPLLDRETRRCLLLACRSSVVAPVRN